MKKKKPWKCAIKSKTKDLVTIKGPKCVLAAVTNQLDDQVLGVPSARAELWLAFFGVGTDEEQPAVPDLGQGQGVVEVGDAAGSWKVLEETTASQIVDSFNNHLKYVNQNLREFLARFSRSAGETPEWTTRWDFTQRLS